MGGLSTALVGASYAKCNRVRLCESKSTSDILLIRPAEKRREESMAKSEDNVRHA